MNYLQPNEYENYGIEKTTLAAWIAAASSLIDAHCRRATLAVASYTERQRLRAGRNTCRLTYLPPRDDCARHHALHRGPRTVRRPASR
jgi:hypothetical protein